MQNTPYLTKIPPFKYGVYKTDFLTTCSLQTRQARYKFCLVLDKKFI